MMTKRGRIVWRDGFGNVTRAFEFASERVKDFVPMFRELQASFPENRREMFRTNGWGEWPARQGSEMAYMAIKRAQTGKDELLRWDGGRNALRLIRSLTERSHPEHISVATRDKLVLGSRVPYLTRQRRGGVAPARLGGGAFPARDPLMIGTFARMINLALSAHLAAVAREVGGVRHGQRTGDVDVSRFGGSR